VDGVIATDPVALSYLLKATGPVTLGDSQQLTSNNAVSLLLRDVYHEFDDPDQQDAFFASAAEAVFQRITSGHGDATAVVDALTKAGDEGRFLVWSSHAQEQRRILGTVLDGVLSSTENANPTVGVFYNDALSSKMSYYLHTSQRLTGGQCRPNGFRDLLLTITMTSKAPAEGLSPYVAGDVDPYTVSTVVYVASPVGGGVVEVRVDGRLRPVNTQQVAGRSVSAFTVDLRPGQSAEVTAYLVAPNIPGQARLRVTPMVRQERSTVDVSGCGTL